MYAPLDGHTVALDQRPNTRAAGRPQYPAGVDAHEQTHGVSVSAHTSMRGRERTIENRPRNLDGSLYHHLPTLRNDTMLLRPEVFDDDHLPQRLLHREPETKQLLRALDPGPDGSARGHALISGASGVGKTVLTRYCCRRIRRERSIDTAYVRCLGATTGIVLRETVEDLRYGSDDLAHNTPTEDVIDELHSAVRDTAVVILDEADDVDDRAVELLSDVRGVSIVMICHEPERWYSAADPEVRDRLQAGTEIILDRYGVSELADILERRAEVGLERGAVRREQLEQIADDVAGVARNGIQSLRAAAELATERGHETIETVDIEDGYERARQAIREANLRSLPVGHLVLYEIVRQAGEIEGDTLHQQYENIADETFRGTGHRPVGRRARRDKLQKLVAYDLIAYEGNNQNRRYRPADPDLRIPEERFEGRLRVSLSRNSP
jgi:Cdc6-like AAA superfamily ATPase